MLIDKKEPRLPEFDEVKAKITATMKQQRAQEQLEQKAKEIASSANTPAELKAAAEKARVRSLNRLRIQPGIYVRESGEQSNS